MKDLKEIGKKVSQLADKNGWVFIEWQEKQSMISFMNAGNRINVWLTKMTVATCINHPKQGKTQLFRKNVSFDELDKIFKNPRIHTNKGYHTLPKNKFLTK